MVLWQAKQPGYMAMLKNIAKLTTLCHRWEFSTKQTQELSTQRNA